MSPSTARITAPKSTSSSFLCLFSLNVPSVPCRIFKQHHITCLQTYLYDDTMRQVKPKRLRSRYSVRPFFISTLIITLLTTYALFIRGPAQSEVGRRGLETTLSEKHECRAVNQARDKCAFVKQYCDDDEAGLISYLTFYYCTLGKAKPVAFGLMVIWLGALFSTIGIAASDFFSVNLSTIASILGLSESLAGVTFLAFGNGSPDVFSTFAAMGSNSGSMAVGELIGAAGFITAVVAGSMALVREFGVSKKTFVRDICFFIVAVGFSMGFLADGKLVLWECFVMIGFYLFYVVTVVGWHWISAKRKARRTKDVLSRSHFHGPNGHGADALEPYRDDEDDFDTAPVGGRSTSNPELVDISALERAAPAIEINGSRPVDEEDEEDEERHVAAEMTSSMRVMRPRWGRSNTTMTPIRPSLVGALEFRAVLASLQRARNMHLTPLPARQGDYFDSQPHHTSSSLHSVPEDMVRKANRDSESLSGKQHHQQPRIRALSAPDAPLHLETVAHPELVIKPSSPADSPQPAQQAQFSSIGGLLQHQHLVDALNDVSPIRSPSMRTGSNLSLQIPGHSAGSSGQSSPSLSPFPGLTESPAPISPNLQAQNSSPTTPNAPPAPLRRPTMDIGIGEPEEGPRPVKWWPYKALPPPHILLGTLFPTMQGWKEKSVWDKAISLASVPSIFLLVTTLPVVESDHHNKDDEDEEDIAAKLASPIIPNAASTSPSATMQPTSEWQEYRRRTRSVNSRSSIPSPARLSNPSAAPESAPLLLLPEPSHASEPSTTTDDSSPPEWHRWLVALQLFTGPLFVVLITWANTSEDLPSPKKALLRMVLYTLLASFVMLAILLLTTSPHKKPKYHSLLCFLGFVISIAWISTIAGEVVGVLKTLGVILGISEAILGLTVFAVGNSLGDLVADVTVARLGYPVMALYVSSKALPSFQVFYI